MKNSGKIITIEKNSDKISRAKKNFKNADITNIVKIKQGEASDVLSELNKEQKYKEFFDFILIDVDKENAFQYFRNSLPMLKINGIIATDNMLYPEKYRNKMKKYSDKIHRLNNIMSLLVPIGNGEEITIKLR